MSGFIKKIWKDRVTEFPTRRSLTKQDGSVELVTVAREEGTVSQEGDAFSAQNMNDLEERVKTAFDAVDSSLTNESQETFNFGVKDGVRGFFTNPSRADDCFVPFSGNPKYIDSASVVETNNNVTATVTISNLIVGKKYLLVAVGTGYSVDEITLPGDVIGEKSTLEFSPIGKIKASIWASNSTSVSSSIKGSAANIHLTNVLTVFEL